MYEPIEVRIDHFKINIYLSQSAWNNATRYYAVTEALLDKKFKTLGATKHAIKAALEEAKLVSSFVSMRKTFCFEKCYWFSSNDTYLTIGGRGAQNGLTASKYISRTQYTYVHPHIHGASSPLINNPNGKQIDLSLNKLKLEYSNKYDVCKDRNYFDVPQRTTKEACMCGCRSGYYVL